MDLVDALSGNTTAKSPVELSLNPAFRREHPSIFDAVEKFFQPQPSAQNKEGAADPTWPQTQRLEQEKEMTRLIASTIPPLEKRSHHLLALDVTPVPRPFAKTLKDRMFVYSPNPVANNRPVTIGHACSMLTYIPEKKNPDDPRWVVPLSARRVDSGSLETIVGAEQTESLLADTELPFHKELVVKVSDSKYCVRPHVSRTAKLSNLVDIERCAGNRTFYQSPPPLPEDQKRPANHPTWYGDKFSMQDESTWHSPTQTAQMIRVTKKGKELTLTIQCWDDMLMRDKDGIVMHSHPFRLVRVTSVDHNGQLVYKRPMWLLVFGDRRGELSLVEIVEAFLQRFDIEHFFRFGKQKLLMTAAQTPNVETEENWWQIVILAYAQLWMSRELAQQIPRPWEKKPDPETTTVASPAVAQRDFGRLIQQFGTPAKPPKPRGYSPGRKKGDKQPPRKRHPVIKKSKSPPKSKPT